jgi:hypothetical protein
MLTGGEHLEVDPELALQILSVEIARAVQGRGRDISARISTSVTTPAIATNMAAAPATQAAATDGEPRRGVRRAAQARRSGSPGSPGSIAASTYRNLDGTAMALRLQPWFAMKKSTHHKLALHVQTIRLLGHEALDGVAGGNLEPAPRGFIMKDTVIIRTGG